MWNDQLNVDESKESKEGMNRCVGKWGAWHCTASAEMYLKER